MSKITWTKICKFVSKSFALQHTFNSSSIKTNKKANSFLEIKHFFKSFVIGVRKHNMLKCSKFIFPKCILSSMKVGIPG